MEKIPPSNIEAERALLGALIIDNKGIYQIDLEGDDFYQTKHQLIFKALKSMVNSGGSVDALVLKDWVDKNGLGEMIPASYLARLTNEIGRNIKKYAEIIKDCSLRRKMIEANTKNEALVWDDSMEVSDIIAKAQTNINNIGTVATESNDIKDIVEELGEMQNEYAKQLESGKKYIGIPTGFEKIDNVIDGFRPGHIWAIGAYTSSGKTMFVLNLILQALEENNPVCLISLEMSRTDLTARLIGVRQNISAISVLKGSSSPYILDQVNKGIEFMHGSKLTIYNSLFTLDRVKMAIRKEVAQRKTKIFVIDYIQNFVGFSSEYEKVTIVSTEMQALARDLGVTIIIISQISNEAEKGQAPGAGFKGSQTLEAVADLAIRLKRDKANEDPAANQVPVMIQICKNRHGFTGVISDYSMYLKSGRFTETPVKF